MNKVEVGSVSMDQSRQRKTKLLLLLVGLVFSAAVFLTLDWFRSAAIRRTAESSSSRSNQGAYRPFIGSCGLHDPVRHHVLKPNCASLGRWGGDTYEVLTNSLGFRDERIREVPLADLHPRILMLGDSMTEGIIAWRDSYVGRVAAHFPQYDFLNGGVPSYSPSNYLNTARIVLAKGVDIDEVIVFIDISDVQDEAFWYRDVDASGAVTGPDQLAGPPSWYQTWRSRVSKYFMLTNYLYGFCERFLVVHGYPHLIVGRVTGDPFDMDRGAWTYRRVDETSYAPLGVEGGIAKEKAKMTLLWQELEKRNIPISVVVYPWPAQILHDTAESRQVRIWREWCEGKCKRFISLFPAFLALKKQCSWSRPGCWYPSLFVFGDVHFNAAGNALVADAVIKALAEEPPTKRLQSASEDKQPTISSLPH